MLIDRQFQNGHDNTPIPQVPPSERSVDMSKTVSVLCLARLIAPYSHRLDLPA
jgi:hypothetical protein